MFLFLICGGTSVETRSEARSAGFWPGLPRKKVPVVKLRETTTTTTTTTTATTTTTLTGYVPGIYIYM